MSEEPLPHIAVVIPCYRVSNKILEVLARIGEDVASIYVVDDACPDRPGDLVERHGRDPRVKIIRRAQNGGVGAATLDGMAAASEAGARIIVKIDGDGQMDPNLILTMIAPILDGSADYTKGNRFFSPAFVSGMPYARVFGNGVLSFMIKFSSGYWAIMDPTNGFIAIHAAVFRMLPQERLARNYFFESDVLFRLNLLRAQVIDVPQKAVYNDEVSNLRLHRVIVPFLGHHLLNFSKRIVYSYFVRDFSIASIYLSLGIPLFLAGVIYGGYEWALHASSGVVATAGTVMLAALPIIIGFQLILSFLGYDIVNAPRSAIHPQLPLEPGALALRSRRQGG